MWRLCPALFAISAACAQVSDPVFSHVPFAQWNDAGQTRMRWRSDIAPLGLNDHQRLMYRLRVKLDGAELVKRRGKGEFLVLVEITDSQNRAYQTHGSMSLEAVKDETSRSDLEYAQNVLLTPGDYRAAIAVYVSTTGEYALARRPLHVDALPRDPLPDAWRGLPDVELLPNEDPPDSWFLPTVQGRLNLPVETHRRVEIEVLLNTTPSEEVPGSRAERIGRHMLGVLLPSMKTLVQLTPANGSMKLALLDLARQKVIFQSAVGVEWSQLKNVLTEASPNMIDVHALEKRRTSAQFLVKEVARRVEESHGSNALHVLIVLSAPMTFASGADLSPIETSADKNCKVFYIRYFPIAPRVLMAAVPDEPNRRGPAPFPRGLTPIPPDSLEKTLKPLNPRLFEVSSPGDFRKALATMIDEIERASR